MTNQSKFDTPENGGPEFRFARAAAARFRHVTFEQAMKGFRKYGVELDPADPKYDWYAMWEQEQVDGWQYAQCARRERDLLRARIIELEAGIIDVMERMSEMHLQAPGKELLNLLSYTLTGANVWGRSKNAVAGQMEANADE